MEECQETDTAELRAALESRCSGLSLSVTHKLFLCCPWQNISEICRVFKLTHISPRRSQPLQENDWEFCSIYTLKRYMVARKGDTQKALVRNLLVSVLLQQNHICFAHVCCIDVSRTCIK